MSDSNIRQDFRPSKPAQYHILVVEQETDFARVLKQDIEVKLPVEVVLANTAEQARQLLIDYPEKFFLSVASVVNLDSDAFEKIDLLAEFQIPVIALVDEYEDELRDQLIKRHVVDYVVKDSRFETNYICDLIHRLVKNVSIRVLVVDDSKVAQFVIARELALQKFDVIQVSDGEEAIAILEANQDIKLTLVDYQMSGIDGVTFASRARALYSKDEMSIIGISTSADPRLAVKFLKAGANDFISKPFNYEMMLCRINQNLDMLDAVDYAKHLSNVDFLSNVYNRRYFFQQGNKIFNSLMEGDVLTVMMIDIDFFKNVNDVYGHDAGDEVIKHLAAELKDYFSDDIVARMGGEEFAVLSLNPDYYYSFDTINTFRMKVAQHTLDVKGKPIKYTCSIGVSNILGKNLDDMMVHADRLLYIAKQSGRNRVEGNPSGAKTEEVKKIGSV